jgi:pyruvate dehydrogenase E1 component beta subunit
MPDIPEPTSFGLTEKFHPGAGEVAEKISMLLDRPLLASALAKLRRKPHDVPGTWFQGPF